MDKRSFSLMEIAAAIFVIVVLASALFPVFSQVSKAQAVECQTNMSRIAKALKMYVSDWDGYYPTNRSRSGNTLSSIIMPTVRLSDPSLQDTNGDPIRFQYGFGWVEDLYPYLERTVQGDGMSVWKCPAARNIKGPNTGSWPGTTYAFNSNLVEMPKWVVRDAGRLMMVREMDRIYESILKPQSPTPSSSPLPIDPFLRKNATPSGLKYALHSEGSNVLFADGHVRTFPVSYFPATPQWDTQTNDWYNYVNAVSTGDPRYKSIAITP